MNRLNLSIVIVTLLLTIFAIVTQTASNNRRGQKTKISTIIEDEDDTGHKVKAIVLPRERAKPIRECRDCKRSSERKACLPTKTCKPLGTRCSEAPEFGDQKVVTVTSHHCNLPDGSKGVSLFCCNEGTREALNIQTLRAYPHEYPHQAFLISDITLLGQEVHSSCGGTIINEQWIVTASHCTQIQHRNPLTNLTAIYKPSKISVVVGQNHVTGTPEVGNLREVGKWVDHPEFGYGPIRNDITLVKLAEPLTFSPYVHPLPLAGPDFKAEGMAEIIGWGKTDTKDTLGALLTEIGSIIPNDKCSYLGNSKKPDTVMCVGGGEDAIPNKGDSGGPAICRDDLNQPILCGITSYVQGSVICEGGHTRKLDLVNAADLPVGCVYQPTVFTRISKYRQWIRENMK